MAEAGIRVANHAEARAGYKEFVRTTAPHPGVVAFAKDLDGRMMLVRPGAASTFGFTADADLIGRTDFDLVPGPFAEEYRRDDREALASGRIVSRPELFVSSDGMPRWYRSKKWALQIGSGAVVGVAVVMRPDPALVRADDPLASAIERMKTDLADSEPVSALARLCHLSERQFEHRFRQDLGVSPSGLRHRLRIARVCEMLLTTTTPIAEIAAATGFYDQSALARRFRMLIGTAPSEYRRLGTAPLDTLRSDRAHGAGLMS